MARPRTVLACPSRGGLPLSRPTWFEAIRRRRRPASPGAWAERSRARRSAAIGAALFLAVATALAAGGVALARRATAGGTSAGPSIVVLPLVNLDGDPEQDYFADGMTEELVSALGQVPGLRVIGRTSTFALKGQAGDLAAFGRRLGVTSVLEGSVRRAGNRLRVRAQIVDARDGYQLWSRTFERDQGDVLAIQDEIGQAVARALEVRLTGLRGRDEAGRPVDPEVYNQYLLARRFLTLNSLDGFARAASASNDALARAPGFAPAWATLSAAHAGLADYTEAPDEIVANQKEALAAAARAIALDPQLAEAYGERAELLAQTAWDWEAASADWERALALAPGNATLLRKRAAWFLAPTGRVSEAIESLRRATALDPLSSPTWMALGFLQVASGDGEEGEESLRRALEIDPQSDLAREALVVRWLLAGRPERALAVARGCSSDIWRLWGVALAEHSLGNRTASDAALAELTERFASPSPYQIAEVHAWRGEDDAAFTWLGRALEGLDGGLLMMQWDPLLAGLRGDPRLDPLRHRMHLPGS
ncbi:MAG TPA: hypothetical protein VFM53_09215 [Anaeromyxobacteraceae bacterium]|nr:hypothetical protein [Anaeromyxobacteraceae bacterium]